MEEFKKCKRDAKLLLADEWRNWRLASVDEVNNNFAKIRGMENLRSWNTVRLLDGCVEKYRGLKQYRPNMEDMILVKTEISRPEDGSFAPEMYSGVQLFAQGGEVALSLACEDKITEAILFVLFRIVNKLGDAEISKKSPRKVFTTNIGNLMKSLRERFDNGRKVLQCAVDQQHNQKHPVEVAMLMMEIFKDEKELLKEGDIYGRTVLHFAALRGNVELCHLLIKDWKMRADETDINKEHVLHFAVKGKQIAVLKYLCKLPEVQSIIGSPDAQGKTALHKAAAQGSTEMIKTLVSCISKSRDRQMYIYQAHLLEQADLDPDEEEKIKLAFIRQADLFGQTALLEAARGGHVEAVKLLLGKGSRPLHERNSDGRSALHYAVQLSNDQEAKEMAGLLLENCKSDDEKSLLLWVWATGIGTADEYFKTKEEKQRSRVEDYLKIKRGHDTQSLEDLFSIAIELGHDNIAWELVKRGANTADIRTRQWSDEQNQRVVYLLNQLRKINEMPARGRDQPAIKDSLGRKELAEGLATLFLNPYVKSPLTVGIFGDWGMGKSSLMIQTETILLKTAAQLSFPNLLDTEQFPECRKIEQSPKVRQTYEKINKAAKALLPSSAPASEDDPLVQFLDGDYQLEYHEVYKSLALRDRNEMFPSKDGDEAADSSSNRYSLRKIPSILTVRYNAWYYQNEQEAWAGLAVETTKAIEESMTRAQRLRCRCRYAWREHGSKIFLELFLPCLLALFLSVWVAWAVWKLLTRSKHKDLQDLKYGSIPVTLLVIVWTVVRQLVSVLKPISVQIMGYLQLPNHRTNLGYQHQVISDINFLKEEIGEKPSRIWRFIAGLCSFFGRYPDTVRDTSVPRSPPPHMDDIRMIVFVDDLDRCRDKVILQVLSAVNLVLAACNINVVLGMDMNMIARVMKSEFPDSENPEELAEKYISKMVQLSLALPDTSEDEIQNFLDEQLGPAFEAGFPPDDADSKAPTNQIDDRKQSPAGSKKLDCKSSISKTFEIPFQLFSVFDTDHNQDSVCLNIVQNDTEVCQSFLSKHLFEPLRRFKNCLRGRIHGHEKTMGKLRNMPFNIQMIMPNYTMDERIQLHYLKMRATGAQRLPREWKRFLTYHRIAWHILYKRKQEENTRGWQQQLVIWVFCCWQWKHQINDIIQKWKKLMLVNRFSPNLEDGEDSPTNSSLKSIVEHYYHKIWLPLHHMEEDKDDKEEEEEYMEEEEEEEEEEEYMEERKHKLKKKENDEKLKLEEEKKENDEKLKKLKLEEEEKKENWVSLIDTLTEYDVSIACVDFFQKFRLHCKMGYLSTFIAATQQSPNHLSRDQS